MGANWIEQGIDFEEAKVGSPLVEGFLHPSQRLLSVVEVGRKGRQVHRRDVLSSGKPRELV